MKSLVFPIEIVPPDVYSAFATSIRSFKITSMKDYNTSSDQLFISEKIVNYKTKFSDFFFCFSSFDYFDQLLFTLDESEFNASVQWKETFKWFIFILIIAKSG